MNKNGFTMTSTVIGLVCLALLVFPIGKGIIAFNDYLKTTQEQIQINSILNTEWTTINAQDINKVFAKQNTSDEHKNGDYTVKTTYGKKAKENYSDGSMETIQVTLSIMNGGKELVSKTGVLYLSEKTNNEYVKNETPQNNIKILYNKQDDILQYYVDGREVMKAPKDFTADSGYVQFSNGLIINWGRRNAYHDEDHLENIPFAKAFPHQCFNVIASTSKHGGGRLTSYVHDVYNNSWNLLPGYSHGEGSGTTYWMAIGY